MGEYLGGVVEVINARRAGGSSSSRKLCCSWLISNEMARSSGLGISNRKMMACVVSHEEEIGGCDHLAPVQTCVRV